MINDIWILLTQNYLYIICHTVVGTGYSTRANISAKLLSIYKCVCHTTRAKKTVFPSLTSYKQADVDNNDKNRLAKCKACHKQVRFCVHASRSTNQICHFHVKQKTYLQSCSTQFNYNFISFLYRLTFVKILIK